MKHRLLSALGICKKAGKLVQGFDPVAEAARNGKLSLVLTARDLSEKSRKEILRITGAGKVEHCMIPVTMDEIWYQLGKRNGIVAVADPGLAQTVKRAIVCANEED